MNWGLGTAQFGMRYGLLGKDKQLTKEQISEILNMATGHFQVIDTAADYGNSEELLGEFLPRPQSYSIVTKTPHWGVRRITLNDAVRLKNVFLGSLSRLRLPQVNGLLVHHADDLIADGGELLFAAMEELRRDGKVEKLGVSVYRAEQIDAVIDRFQIDLIQLPFSILDQRMLASGHLKRLKERGIEVHARSIFLQGILLTDPEELPEHFRPLRGHLQEYGRFLNEAGLSRVEAAIGFVSAVPEIDAAIVGVTHQTHLQEILNALQSVVDPAALGRFAVSAAAFLDPTMWRT